MSKLEDLIQELCPHGVEYKKLGDISTISRGGSFQKKTSVILVFHVFIMDKYIHGMVCLPVKHLHLLIKSQQKNQKKQLVMILLWLLRVKMLMMFVSVLPGLERMK